MMLFETFKPSVLLAVDRWQNLLDHRLFLDKTKAHSNIVPVKASAILLSEGFPDDYFDLIYIDLGENGSVAEIYKNKGKVVVINDGKTC